MKSLGANVFFPAWVWAQNPNPENDPDQPFQIRRNSWRGPGVKFMHLSYESTLASRDGVKCRQIITAPWYQRLWGDRVQMRPDQNQKTRFDNLQGGHRISTSEGGVITGEGGDIIIFDDPHNVRDVGGASDVARETTLRFWDESMPSRLNDQDHGVFIVIMQRVHERDLSGHILANELGWTHLCLPAVYESKHPFPIISSVKRKATGETWKDPRREGEPLWPERFSLEALQRIAKDEGLSSHMAAGQLQQRPTAREGGLFKREWFANPVKFALAGKGAILGFRQLGSAQQRSGLDGWVAHGAGTANGSHLHRRRDPRQADPRPARAAGQSHGAARWRGSAHQNSPRPRRRRKVRGAPLRQVPARLRGLDRTGTGDQRTAGRLVRRTV